MFCKHCGKQTEENVKFCKYCGGILSESTPAVEEELKPGEPAQVSSGVKQPSAAVQIIKAIFKLFL